MTNHYDIIIVGLGAMGSAALYQATKAGAKVLGLDRYAPPHSFGSSHAETRITRLAVGEGPQYLPFVARSHQIWRALEEKTGQTLLYQPGGYIITSSEATGTERHPNGMDSHWNRFVERTAEVAQQANIPFERRTVEAVKAHQPAILIRDCDQVGFEPSGGVVMCERAISLQIALAQQCRATVTVQMNEPVTHLAFDQDAVTVVTEQDRYTAEKAIISSGAWLSDFLPATAKDLLTVTRQVVYWFEVEDPAQFSTDHFPFVIWLGDQADDYFSAFPMPPDGVPGLKVLTEQFALTTDPRSVSRQVRQADIDHFYEAFVSKKLVGVKPNCLQTAVCLYTNTPDDHFIIDYHPDSQRVIIASPCSGHGFKHSAAIGEAMVQLALHGQSELDLSHFKFARFEGRQKI